MLYIFKIFIIFSSIISPAAAIGIHGGHTVTLSAAIRPDAFSAGIVSRSAKKASLGDIALTASVISI